MELKKTEVTEKVKESVEQNGKKPELFGYIVRAVIALLERLTAKIMQKVKCEKTKRRKLYISDNSRKNRNQFTVVPVNTAAKGRAARYCKV